MKISKDDIIETSFEIVKNEGMDALTVRKIANKLHASVQPIYYQFGSLEELKKELWKKVESTYQNYMHRDLGYLHPYKRMGLNYIRFAKEEPILFQLLFLSDTAYTEQTLYQEQTFTEVCKAAQDATGLTEEKVKKYHLRMWIYTHGLACMVARKTCNFTEDELSNLLTDEYQALNLLEKERKNEDEKSD